MSVARLPAIAVVVPILNEAPCATALADQIQRQIQQQTRRQITRVGAPAGRTRAASEVAPEVVPEVGPEVVIVDGGSDDDGPARFAERLPAARLLSSPRGRARQMNAGA